MRPVVYPRRHPLVRSVMRAVLLMVCVSAVAAAAPLPADARLDAERPALQAIVDGAEQEGLPSELLGAKVREGLAKNVPPPRITVAVRALATALKQARDEAQPHLAHPPAQLLKAIVDAHALGAAPGDIEVVLKAARPQTATRAIEVLGDLLQRRYPPQAAARAVAEVAARQPTAAGLAADQAAQLLHGHEAAGPLAPETRGPPRDTTGERGPPSSHPPKGKR